jgi:hypothetical protein
MITWNRSIERQLLAFITAVFLWAPLSLAAAADLSIYSDKLAADWSDWSWGVTKNLSNATPVHSGAASVAVTITSGWSAFYLHPNTAVSTASYDQIRFWVHGGTSGAHKLQLVANANGNQAYSFTTSANAWTLISIPLSALGDPATLADLYWQDNSGGAQASFYLDDITLVQRPVAPTVDLPIYTDALASGWVDWSWSSSRNFSNTAPVHGGANSLALTITSGWGALFLHTDTPVDTYGYGSISFWVHGASAGNQKLQVSSDFGAHNFPFTATAGAWTQISIPLSALGNPGSLTDLWWSDTTGGAQATLYVDDIALVRGSGGGGVGQPVVGPALSIDAGANRHAISADIYGVNFQSEALIAELHLPVRRWGGNSTTRYNWQNDTTNTANDWYYENIPNQNSNPAALPDGSASDRFVEENQRTGTRTLLTVPTIGWVAKRRTAGHPYDCGFRVSKYGAQQATDPWDSDCGNGKTVNGADLTGIDPTDTSVAVGPSFVSQWIKHLTDKYGTAAKGGVSYYALDNEPMIWSGTHRDIHPEAPTYDEMRDRAYQYGAAIKAADPGAKILGPVEDGWCRYLYSMADNCLPGKDYQTHGNTQYVPWYLQQMRSYEQQHGTRLLDYLDLHFYPWGVSGAPSGSAATQALRLRSTRALWDASYIDESWISDTASGGVAVQLIPRMKKWAADNYPGTKLAISEYDWGAGEGINGALAQADVLGIFGREGLDLATYWGDVVSSQPFAFAFRMYRNYDGLGHGFGDSSVQASSADQGKLSVYTAQRSTDGALTILVINKSDNDLSSSVGLAGFNPQPSAVVYRYSKANLAAIEHAADQAVTTSGFSATFPANSITLLVVAAAGQTTIAVQPKWNLLGNSSGQSFQVAGVYADASWINSVWKWDAVLKRWQFYSPALKATELQTFANDRGYGVISEIRPGEGYWVNAKVASSVLLESGAAFNLTMANLVSGWNLAATGNTVTPSLFNVSLSATQPAAGVVPQNITSLWAWDGVSQGYYFYAPGLEAQGGSALSDYVSVNHYLDFTSSSKTLGPGVGFWVNKP